MSSRLVLLEEAWIVALIGPAIVAPSTNGSEVNATLPSWASGLRSEANWKTGSPRSWAAAKTWES